jgi:hypothetical protein
MVSTELQLESSAVTEEVQLDLVSLFVSGSFMSQMLLMNGGGVVVEWFKVRDVVTQSAADADVDVDAANIHMSAGKNKCEDA